MATGQGCAAVAIATNQKPPGQHAWSDPGPRSQPPVGSLCFGSSSIGREPLILIESRYRPDDATTLISSRQADRLRLR
jgi:hypothetical protein